MRHSTSMLGTSSHYASSAEALTVSSRRWSFGRLAPSSQSRWNKIFPRIHWDGVPWRIYLHQLLNFSIMHAYRQGIIKAYRVKMSNLAKPSVFRAFGTLTSDVKFNESGSETLLHASCPFNESLHVSILLLQSMDEFKRLQFCFFHSTREYKNSLF